MRYKQITPPNHLATLGESKSARSDSLRGKAVVGIVNSACALRGSGAWDGTVTELARLLSGADATAAISAEHLSIWLHRHEPSLWWTHGIWVRFSRTRKGRLVHLSLRDRFGSVDGYPVILTGTPEEDCTQSAVDVIFRNR